MQTWQKTSISLGLAYAAVVAVNALNAQQFFFATSYQTAGGGGGSLSDTFGGSSVDGTKWNVVTAGSGTVTESGGYLNVTGDNNWGHAYVESILTWDRTAGDITIQVTVNSPSCNNGQGTVGWGDGVVNGGSGVQSDLYLPFGTEFFAQHDNNSSNCLIETGSSSTPCDIQIPTASPSGCTANTDYLVKIVVHNPGASLYLNNVLAATLDLRDKALYTNNKHVVLTSLNGLAKFKDLTASQ